MNIFKRVTILSIMFFLVGCQQGEGSKHGRVQTTPHLMRGIYQHSANNTLPTNPKVLQMQHEEKLATIQAQKEKALKELELQKSLNAKSMQERTKEIEAQSELKLAQEKRKYAKLIEESKERLKAIEAKIAKEKALAQKEIVKMKTQSDQSIEKLKAEYAQKMAILEAQVTKRRLWVALSALFLILIFWFFIYRARKDDQLRQERERHLHEAQMLQKRQQHEQIQKVLDIIASKDTDKEVKVELAKLLQNGISQDEPKLLEYKPKEE